MTECKAETRGRALHYRRLPKKSTVTWQVGGGGDARLNACAELASTANRLDSVTDPGARTTLWRKRSAQPG